MNVVTFIIKMARSSGVQAIAEGAENQEQAYIPSGLGCDLAQGHIRLMCPVFPALNIWLSPGMQCKP